MDRQYTPIQLNVYRSWLVPAALICGFFATVLGLPGIILIFDQEYQSYLLLDMLAGEIGSVEAIRTYRLIHNVTVAVSTGFAGLLTACAALAVFGKPARGMGGLATAAQWLVWGLNLVGVILAVLFVWRFVRYTVYCLRLAEGFFALLAMVFFEAVMGAAAVAVFWNLRKFADRLCDTAASMAYTLSSGYISAPSIPSSTSSGFLILGIVFLVLSLDQTVTLTVVEDAYAPYYQLVTASHPGQAITAASFLCSAGMDILWSCYLRRYKTVSERTLYHARKRRANN